MTEHLSKRCKIEDTNYMVFDIETTGLTKEDINVNTDTNYMVLDIETTGLTKEDFIIQIAYNVYDNNMDCLTKHNYLINENVNKTDFFNRFTVDEIIEKGLSAEVVLNQLKEDLSKCKYIIGHNISFDVGMIARYYRKYNIECVIPKSICTMISSKFKLKLKNTKGWIKNPKLSELYKFYYSTDANEDTLHDASYDIDITFLCFKKLAEDRLIIL